MAAAFRFDGPTALSKVEGQPQSSPAGSRSHIKPAQPPDAPNEPWAGELARAHSATRQRAAYFQAGNRTINGQQPCTPSLRMAEDI